MSRWRTSYVSTTPKNKMRFLCVILAFLIFSFNLTPVNVQADGTTIQPKVYITDTGKYYHSKDCHYLRSKIPIGLYTAKEKGYTACSYCGGKSDGYYTQKDYEDYLDSLVPDKKEEQTTTSEKKNNNDWIVIVFLIGLFAFIVIESINEKNKK